MAIAVDSKTIGTHNQASWSHTCTGSNLILFVFAENQPNGSPVTGVTYNGVAMTQIGSTLNSGGNSAANLWYLIAPATGTHTVTMSASGGFGGNFEGVSASYTGVDQTTPINVSPNGSGTGTSATTSTTTTVDKCWAVYLVLPKGVDSTASTNSTLIAASFADHASAYDNSAVAPITPAGSYSMSATLPSAVWQSVMAVFAPSATTPNNSGFFLLM